MYESSFMLSIVVYMRLLAGCGCMLMVLMGRCSIPLVAEQLSEPCRLRFPSVNMAGSTIQNKEKSKSVSSSFVS